MMADDLREPGMPELRGEFLSHEQQGFEVLDRRRRVAQLYLSRVAITRIAVECNVSRATVHRDLCWLREQWKKDALADLSQRKAEELERIDNLERIAYEAWERSLQPRAKRREQTTKGRAKKDGTPLPDLIRREERKDEQGGDPRYLEIVYKCIAQRCMLLGLTNLPAGSQTAVTVVGGIDLAVVLGQKKVPPSGPVSGGGTGISGAAPAAAPTASVPPHPSLANDGEGEHPLHAESDFSAF
jgi:hypothetical protein